MTPGGALPLRDLALILLCVAGICIGQVLFKLTAQSLDPRDRGLTAVWQLVLNPLFIGAILLYLATTLLWVWTLRSVPLGTAYSFMALAFVVVPVLGAVWLGEPLHARVAAGSVLIALGIWVATR